MCVPTHQYMSRSQDAPHVVEGAEGTGYLVRILYCRGVVQTNDVCVCVCVRVCACVRAHVSTTSNAIFVLRILFVGLYGGNLVTFRTLICTFHTRVDPDTSDNM